MRVPPPQRLLTGPLIVPGVAGVFLLMLNERVELCPQPFTARTLNVPPQKAEPKLSVMLLVPAPAVMVVPAGTVHW